MLFWWRQRDEAARAEYACAFMQDKQQLRGTNRRCS
jgi:hypothetical protein